LLFLRKATTGVLFRLSLSNDCLLVDLQGQDIVSITDGIERLTSAASVLLAANKLTAIPAGVLAMVQLVHLDVSALQRRGRRSR